MLCLSGTDVHRDGLRRHIAESSAARCSPSPFLWASAAESQSHHVAASGLLSSPFTPLCVQCSADGDSNSSTHGETQRDCPPSNKNSNRRAHTGSNPDPDACVLAFLFGRHETIVAKDNTRT